jgi:hypothetical protein
MKCIFCLNNNNDKDEEHIFPEALGCPKEYILKNSEVCKRCNNRLGSKIEKVLIDDYDIYTFVNGIKRKKDKPPIISERGNVYGQYTNTCPIISINNERYQLRDVFNKKLSAFDKNNKRHIYANIDNNKISFRQTIGASNPVKFVRAIYKIGFELLCFEQGHKEVIKGKYDNLRRFIRYGEKPIRKCFLLPNDTFIKAFPMEISKNENYLRGFQLYYLSYLIDLSNENNLYDEIKINLMKKFGKNSWTYLPL